MPRRHHRLRAGRTISGSRARLVAERSERQRVKPLQKRPTVLELPELRLRPDAFQRHDLGLGVLTRCSGAWRLQGATIAIQNRIRSALSRHDQVLSWEWSLVGDFAAGACEVVHTADALHHVVNTLALWRCWIQLRNWRYHRPDWQSGSRHCYEKGVRTVGRSSNADCRHPPTRTWNCPLTIDPGNFPGGRHFVVRSRTHPRRGGVMELQRAARALRQTDCQHRPGCRKEQSLPRISQG